MDSKVDFALRGACEILRGNHQYENRQQDSDWQISPICAAVGVPVTGFSVWFGELYQTYISGVSV